MTNLKNLKIKEMTREEFNTKYYDNIETREYENKAGVKVIQRFDGLEFDIPEVTKFLDKVFQDFTRIPGFTYAQIKLKFGTARFYTNLKCPELNFFVEDQINKIIKTDNDDK
jgi:hypothetical protein